jgi:CRP-like cAMP-binding protein
MDHLDLIRAQFPNLTDADIGEVLPLLIVRELAAGEVFIRAGQVNYTSAFVVKGLLRNYHLLDNGTERTVLFTAEGGTIAAYASFFRNMPSVEYIAALEPTFLLTVDMRALRKIMDNNLGLTQAYTQTLERMLLDAIDRIDRFVLLSPEQRYTQFRHHHLELEQRIPQKHLASYLGITAISLSRMRNRMVKRKLT